MTADPVRAAATQLRTRRSETNRPRTFPLRRRAARRPPSDIAFRPTVCRLRAALKEQRSSNRPSSNLRDAENHARRLVPNHPPTVAPPHHWPAVKPTSGKKRFQSARCRRAVTLWGGCPAADPARSSVTRQSRSESSPLATRPPPTLPPAAIARSECSRRGRSAQPQLETAARSSRPEGHKPDDHAPEQMVGFRQTVLRELPATKAP
jgi:hypothetical protein